MMTFSWASVMFALPSFLPIPPGCLCLLSLVVPFFYVIYGASRSHIEGKTHRTCIYVLPWFASKALAEIAPRSSGGVAVGNMWASLWGFGFGSNDS